MNTVTGHSQIVFFLQHYASHPHMIPTLHLPETDFVENAHYKQCKRTVGFVDDIFPEKEKNYIQEQLEFLSGLSLHQLQIYY